jgi:hypothetical protein
MSELIIIVEINITPIILSMQFQFLVTQERVPLINGRCLFLKIHMSFLLCSAFKYQLIIGLFNNNTSTVNVTQDHMRWEDNHEQ